MNDQPLFTETCPICLGKGELNQAHFKNWIELANNTILNDHLKQGWWDRTVKDLVDLELAVLSGFFGYQGALVRAVAYSVGFSDKNAAHRFGMIQLSASVEEERQRRIKSDPVASVLLKEADFGGCFISLSETEEDSGEHNV